MMRSAAIVLFVALSGSSAFAAVDVARLPDVCKETIATLKSDKARFTELGGVMAKAQKAKDNANFCVAAKQTLAIIVVESDQLDHCLGELAIDKTTPQDTVGQFTEVKNYYRKMLAAAKEPTNDRMHCGLADQ